MSVWKAIFLGLLQGFTEFLPVSSSGHLAVAQNFFGFDSGQSVTFTVLLHLGTLAAVCIMYRRDVWMIIKGFFTLVGKLFTGRLRREGLESGERLFLLLALATLPLLPAVLLESYVESLSAVSWAVGVLLLVNGAILFLSDKLSSGRESLDTAGPGKALLVGVVQMVAIFPGISRSGSTITGGLFAGFRREDAVRFSFLLSIPAILRRQPAQSFPDLFETGLGGESALPMLLGVAAALLSGIAAIRLLRYITKNKSFTPFSIYCALAGAAVIAADLLR